MLFDVIMDAFGKDGPSVPRHSRETRREATRIDNLMGTRILVVDDNRIVSEFYDTIDGESVKVMESIRTRRS